MPSRAVAALTGLLALAGGVSPASAAQADMLHQTGQMAPRDGAVAAPARQGVTWPMPASSADPGARVGAPTIKGEGMVAHLEKFEAIAKANGGHRFTGSAGFKETLTYVEAQLKAVGFETTRQTCPKGPCVAESDNLIAELPGGDASQVHLFGAHIDSVKAGAGINDNGSGAAMVLELALEYARVKPVMTNKVRFAWWTDEENGLNGSKFYAKSLGADKSKIKGYSNFDMVASRNGGVWIHSINNAVAAPLKEYFTAKNLSPSSMGGGGSDHSSFSAIGVPVTFLFMGGGGKKSESEAKKWGGTAGAPYDPCYHKECDRYPEAINKDLLVHAAQASSMSVAVAGKMVRRIGWDGPAGR